MSFSVYKFLKRIQKVNSNGKLESQEKAVDLIETVAAIDTLTSDILNEVSIDDVQMAIKILEEYNPSKPKQNSEIAQMILSQIAKDNLENVKCEITNSNTDFF